MTLTILEIRETDCARIGKQVTAQLARTPGFFARMPVLLSLPGELPDLKRVCEILREQDMVVVGVIDASDAVAKAADDAGLAQMKSSVGSKPRESPASAPAKARTAPDAARVAGEAAPEKADSKKDSAGKTPTRLITKPVRSGQQIYARGGDLVIAAAVSEGAEVLADGHIHIYGALRGRALAGASGDVDARIFCRRFEPELVAVAGCYQVADAMEESIRCKAVQVSLDNDNLHIELQE